MGRDMRMRHKQYGSFICDKTTVSKALDLRALSVWEVAQ